MMVQDNSSYEEDPEEYVSSSEEDPEEDEAEQPEPLGITAGPPLAEADRGVATASPAVACGVAARLPVASELPPPPPPSSVAVPLRFIPPDSTLDSNLFSTNTFEQQIALGEKEKFVETRTQSKKQNRANLAIFSGGLEVDLGSFNDKSSGSNWRCGSIQGEERRCGSEKSVNWYGGGKDEVEVSSVSIKHPRKTQKPKASTRDQGWDFNRNNNGKSYKEWMKPKKPIKPKVTIVNHRPITRSMTPRFEALHTFPKTQNSRSIIEEGRYKEEVFKLPKEDEDGSTEFNFGELLDLLTKLRQIDKNHTLESIKPELKQFIDGLFKGKRKMEELDGVQSFEDCRRVIKKEIPPKLEDPGPITVPLAIGKLVCQHALCDSGASENIIPTSVFKKLGLAEIIREYDKTITLANNSIVQPRGMVKNVLIGIHDFKYLADFVIIDMEGEKDSPITLGRPLLFTTGFILDMRSLAFSFSSGNRKVVYREEKSTSKNEKGAYGNEVVVGLERKRISLGRRWLWDESTRRKETSS